MFVPTLKVIAVAALSLSLFACGSGNQNGTTAANNVNNQGVFNPNFPNGGVNGGCAPMGAPIAFQAINPVINNVSILAGNLGPSTVHPGQYGQVQIGAGGVAYGMPGAMTKQSQSGSIMISLNGAQGGGQNALSGMVTLNPQFMGMQMGGFNGYNPYNPMGMCISGLGIDAVWQPAYNQQFYNGMPNTGFNFGMSGILYQVQVFVYSNMGPPMNLIF